MQWRKSKHEVDVSQAAPAVPRNLYSQPCLLIRRLSWSVTLSADLWGETLRQSQAEYFRCQGMF